MHASSGSADVADRTWPKSYRSRLELAVVPSAVRIARHWTADQLAAPGPAGEGADADLIDTAVLVVSELVTNAIRAVMPVTAAGGPQAGSQVTLPGRILSFADLPFPSTPTGLASVPRPAGARVAAPPLTLTSADAAAAAASLTSGSPLSAPPRVCLSIARYVALIRIEVHDSSRVPLPAAMLGDDDDESGRGLAVVAALAHSWGWQPERTGKVVWCELTC